MQQISLRYSLQKIVESLVGPVMNELSLSYDHITTNTIEVHNSLSAKELSLLNERLSLFSIHVTSKKDVGIVEQIKQCIRISILRGELRNTTLSTILADKLNYSYSHLSAVFSKETHTSIENFYILIKIEMAKEMFSQNDRTISEVAFELDYSSVSHLSRQFKNVTGLTISQYTSLIKERKK